jgi:acyl-[acyl-carrier-protein] desaturase
MQKLMDKWEIDKITGLTDEAEKARDYLIYRQEWLEFQKE